MVASGLKAASLRRRAVAAVIDGAGLLAVIGGTVALLVWRPSRENDQPPVAAWLERLAKWRAISHGVSVAGAVAWRNSQSPGMRIAGIRLADARTGGPVSVHGAAVRYALTSSWSEFVRPLLPTSDARATGQINCLGCVTPVLLFFVPIYLPAFWSPANQTLSERIAGIIVVEA